MDEDVISTKKDNGTKKKTPFQLQSLEKYYSEEKYPKHKDMEDYAASLNLTYKQIRIWFVERRRKERREKEVHGCCESLPGGHSAPKPDRSILNVGKRVNKNNGLGQSGLRSQAKSKHKVAVNPQTYKLNDSMTLAGNGRLTHKDELSASRRNYNRSSSSQEVVERCTSLKYDRSTELKRKSCSMFSNKRHVNQKTHRVLLQDLLSKDYILKRLFRKDGPPLGAEFDSLPNNASGSLLDSAMVTVQSCRDSQSVSKRRKVLDSAITKSRILNTAPTTKYGIGKGLMTVLRASKFDNLKRSSALNFTDRSADWLRYTTSFKDTLCGASKSMQQLKPTPKRSKWPKKSQEKKKPPMKRKKVEHNKDNQKKPYRTTCKLSNDEPNTLEQPVSFIQLVDDEELELRELQAGPNPLRCSAHLTSNGRHNCPLCKDLLATFPPTTIKMKQPLCTRPWASSQELVKKLFKKDFGLMHLKPPKDKSETFDSIILRFLYNIAATIDIGPFTINELAQAFTDKDSMLLGKIHAALLKYMLHNVQMETSAGVTPRASKDGRFLGFLQFIREQEFDLTFWSQSLNPLTWTEILRQVLVAAGFGSKPNTIKRDSSNKERNLMTKYGLLPRTLKGELFGILFEQRCGGLKVTEMAKAPQIVALDLPHATEDLEQLICSTLSSDITLFEKIAPYAYRLRSGPHTKGEETYQSDSDDSGSVDEDSGDSCTSSDDDSQELNMDVCKQKLVKYKSHHKRTAQKLTKCTEIDESLSGEAWVLGLMEGEYSNLSINEKLDALVALVDLAGAGSSLRKEEPTRSKSAIVPMMQYHGSGGKIKKSSVNNHLMPQSSAIFSNASVEHFPKICSTAAKDRPDVHQMQSIYLGSDRRYNSYWLFLGPCDVSDPGHRRVYFESSEDGHWDVIDTTEDLGALLATLDCRGAREARLLGSLYKKEAFLCQAMDDHMTSESRKTRGCDTSEVDASSGSGSSPISDVDNILGPVEPVNRIISGPTSVHELGSSEEKKHTWDRLQSFDKWIWNDFYSNLSSVKKCRRSYMESLARCQSCHDLYWRDEKHCRICHTTFELDFDLEERYAIHVATCRLPEDSCDFPHHKVLPSQLQALKAAIHAIEASIPEAALSSSWTRSGHKLWTKRLRRTSSLPELLQVLSDFVGAINEEWLYECGSASDSNAALDDIFIYFQTMPQTTSAVALWMVKLDFLIAPYLEEVYPNQVSVNRPQLKRRRASTK